MARPRFPAAIALVLPLALVASCRPPAADDYSDRSRIAARAQGPSDPLGSPDVEGALWAQAANGLERIVYGQPGTAPLVALECETEPGTVPMIAFTRFARADAEAQAIFALIGNGHVERLFVDATRQTNGSWLWQGRLPAADPRFEVLTGRREVEATIPGAGSVKLHPSPLPGELINRCRAAAAAQQQPAAPSGSPEPAPSPTATAG